MDLSEKSWTALKRILDEAFDKVDSKFDRVYASLDQVFEKFDRVDEALANYPTKTDLANELAPIHTELIDINLRIDRELARDPTRS